MHPMKDAQFLNITPSFIVSNRLAISSVQSPVIAMVPLTSMYASP